MVLSKALAPFAPVPAIVADGAGLKLVEDEGEAGAVQALGRMSAFHGQMGMFVRAMAWMLSHGADGMKQASEDAVLSANYIRACLGDVMSVPFGERPAMHEALFDDAWLEGTGLSTLDIAKALIDEGYHPMTVYFPLVVHGAMLIEPTESESKASLDLFIGALRDLAFAAKAGRRSASSALRTMPPAAGWTRPAPPAPRSCAGSSPSRCRKRRSDRTRAKALKEEPGGPSAGLFVCVLTGFTATERPLPAQQAPSPLVGEGWGGGRTACQTRVPSPRQTARKTERALPPSLPFPRGEGRERQGARDRAGGAPLLRLRHRRSQRPSGKARISRPQTMRPMPAKRSGGKRSPSTSAADSVPKSGTSREKGATVPAG